VRLTHRGVVFWCSPRVSLPSLRSCRDLEHISTYCRLLERGASGLSSNSKGDNEPPVASSSPWRLKHTFVDVAPPPTPGSPHRPAVEGDETGGLSYTASRGCPRRGRPAEDQHLRRTLDFLNRRRSPGSPQSRPTLTGGRSPVGEARQPATAASSLVGLSQRRKQGNRDIRGRPYAKPDRRRGRGGDNSSSMRRRACQERRILRSVTGQTGQTSGSPRSHGPGWHLGSRVSVPGGRGPGQTSLAVRLVASRREDQTLPVIRHVSNPAMSLRS